MAELTTRRRLFKSGNSHVIALPPEWIERLGVESGTDFVVTLDEQTLIITIKPAHKRAQMPAGVDAEFARKVDGFIERYRPALTALARQ